MGTVNVGNVVGLVRSETAPIKKYVLWGKILNPSIPYIVEINYWDEAGSAWIPITDPTHQYWLRPALDNTQVSPPSEPTEGDRYLIPDSGATGAWSGKEDQVATWRSGAWTYQIPQDGYIISVRTEANKLFDYRGNYGDGGFWDENDFQVPIAPGDYIPSSSIGVPLGIPDLDINAQLVQDYIAHNGLVFEPTVPGSWPAMTTTIRAALDYLGSLIAGGSQPTYSGPVANQSFGGITAGYDPNGKTALEILQKAMISYINPSFTSFSISGQLTTVEVGTTLSGAKVYVWVIALGSGAVALIDIYDVTAAATLLSNTVNDGTQSQAITTIQLNADGATQSWRGVLHDTVTVQNINSSNFTVTARYNDFYGPSSSLPASSAAVRALGSNRFHTTGAQVFNLLTGTVEVNFIVALPPGKTITGVIDLDALNADLTAQYVLTGTINVLDAGGTNRSYNLYKMTQAIPYSTSHRHQITTN